MEPLEPFRERLLVLHGLSNKVRGERGTITCAGMSCLLTGIELFPGTSRRFGHTRRLASGISIDQELKTSFKQRANPDAFRFGWNSASA